MIMVLAVIAVVSSGCATGTGTVTAVKPKSLDGTHVIYFEQSDRIPKDVLVEANKQPQANATVVGDDMMSDIVEKVIEELIGVAPKMVEIYANERMNNALMGRRILFRGYDSPEQLKEINEIIKSMDKAIEKVTP